MHEIRRDAATGAEPRVGRARWMRPAVAVPAVAVIAAAATFTGVQVTSRDAEGTRAEPTQVVQLLDSIALAAEKSEAPGTIGDDQYVYVDSKVAYVSMAADGSTAPKLDPVHRRQVWKPVDGARGGLVREKLPYLPGKGETKLERDTPGVASNTNYRHLQTLPTDPAKMLEWLHQASDGGKSEDQNTFVLVGDLSRESLMPPKVAAALYRATAMIPGVVVVKDAVDAAGRHGIGIGREDAGAMTQLIFDKKTKVFLGEREVAVRDVDHVKKGDLLGVSAVMRRTVVDGLGQQP